ncbi:hypothetical protein ACFX2I_040689 [Malus domestica]
MKNLSMVFFRALLFIFLNHGVIAEDGFVKTRGMQLVLNGVPYYENGFNAYWLMYMATDPSKREKVSSAFREATNNGLTIARTWDFADGGSYFAWSPLELPMLREGNIGKLILLE